VTTLSSTPGIYTTRRDTTLRVDALLRKYASTYYDEEARKKHDTAFTERFEKRD
jgi:hypothetical protein